VILVDTSVLIGYLRGHAGPKIDLFEQVLERKIPFGISVFTYLEVLQGAKDENEWNVLRDYLGTQQIYYLKREIESYEQAARLFVDLRRKGITVRGSIDLLIMVTALEQSLSLLHDDQDYDQMLRHLTELKVFDQN
jgi:predicted nucleic acid-binding protein